MNALRKKVERVPGANVAHERQRKHESSDQYSYELLGKDLFIFYEQEEKDKLMVALKGRELVLASSTVTVEPLSILLER
jgi:hypothetical protein